MTKPAPALTASPATPRAIRLYTEIHGWLCVKCYKRLVFASKPFVITGKKT